MLNIDWSAEPDLEGLRVAFAMQKNDPVKAKSELEQLSERGSLMAMYHLGNMFSRGDLGQRDFRLAEYWYTRAETGGLVLGSYRTGILCKNAGRYTEAINHLEIGERSDFSPSINLLACLYFDGRGVERDIYKARTLWQRAIAMGHIYAKRNYSRKLITGKYGASNIIDGIKLYISMSKESWRLYTENSGNIDERLL